MNTKKRTVIRLSAALYAALMLFLLLGRSPRHPGASYASLLRTHVNLMPFHTIALFLRSLTLANRPQLVKHAIVNLAGNVILFLPLGFFPSLLWQWPNRLWKTLLLAAGIMTVIELAQMLLLVGTCDIDDLLLNVLGAAIGYGVLYRIKKHIRNRKQESA